MSFSRDVAHLLRHRDKTGEFCGMLFVGSFSKSVTVTVGVMHMILRKKQFVEH